MRLLKVPSWLFGLLKGLVFFLLVWTTYLLLRKRSFNTRLRCTIFIAFLIYWLDSLISWFFRKESIRTRIKRNIALIRPDLDKEQIGQGAWNVAKTAAHSWAAMLGNEFTSLEEIAERIEVKNPDDILNLYKAGAKIIAAVVHTGPVDELIGAIPLYGVGVYVPAEAIKPKWFFRFMMRLRLRLGGVIYEAVEKGKILPNAARHLSNGKMVALMVDITRRDDSGVVCRIGNAKAKFSVGAVKLALEQSATIIPIFPSWRESDNKSLIVIGKPFKPVKTGNMRRDIETNTRRLIEEIYAPHILDNWDQWLRLLWDELEPAENNAIK